MIPQPLEIKSIAELPPLTWREVEKGYLLGFLGWKTVVELATDKVAKSSTSPLEVELASVGKEDTWRISELLEELAAEEGDQDDTKIKKKWLYVVLNWLYQNRTLFEDPFQEVEIIYADFGYPEEIAQFVRFLPETGGYRPQDHSHEENIRRLYDLWRDYLNIHRDWYFTSHQH